MEKLNLKNYFLLLYIQPIYQRVVLKSDSCLKDVHFQNVESIRLLCSHYLADSGISCDVVLPPDELLCDLKLTTRSIYAEGTVWHAGSEYWQKIVARIVDLFLA